MHPSLIPLLPNRVRRTYQGGCLLDEFEGNLLPRDGNCPEDWIASTVRAVNSGFEPIADEGMSWVTGASGKMLFHDLIRQDPEHFLGAQHVDKHGDQLGFLTKLIDSAVRLPLQAHPTSAFARQHLCSPWGKLEVYVIMGIRDGSDSQIRLGFQRPPSPQEWCRIVLEQDMAAMDACFDPIPVQVGQVWLIPGGLPHAIGKGILLLEVMEPSDLVVRCEFNRNGVLIPPEARFMQVTVDLAMQIFDYTPYTVDQVISQYQITPQKLSDFEERLIGFQETECFSITRVTIEKPTDLSFSTGPKIGVVAKGMGTARIGDQSITLRPGTRFFCAASVSRLHITTESKTTIFFCAPS